jgi:hypothetical protein
MEAAVSTDPGVATPRSGREALSPNGVGLVSLIVAGSCVLLAGALTVPTPAIVIIFLAGLTVSEKLLGRLVNSNAVVPRLSRARSLTVVAAAMVTSATIGLSLDDAPLGFAVDMLTVSGAVVISYYVFNWVSSNRNRDQT